MFFKLSRSVAVLACLLCFLLCSGLVRIVPYSGKLSREKIFTNFAVLRATCKSFLRKMVTCTDPWKFSPSKVSRCIYGISVVTSLW